nr:MAG: RNA-dependent RNA polymerase [Riboviria sp.]
MYYIMQVPWSREWHKVDITSLPTSCEHSGVQIPLKFKYAKYDKIAMTKCLHQTYSSKDNDLDFSSIFAFTFAFGIPYDIEKGWLRHLLDRTMFGTKGQFKHSPYPVALKAFMTIHFPAIDLHDVSEEVYQEGCMDPMIYEQIDLFDKNWCEIHSDGKFSVYGVALKDNLIFTVGHVKGGIITAKFPNEDKYWTLMCHNQSINLDICIYKVQEKQFQPRRSVLNQFVDETEFAKYISRKKSFIPVSLAVPRFRDGKMPILQMRSAYAEADITNAKQLDTGVAKGTYRLELGGLRTGITSPGDCGSLLLLHNPQITAKVCGIHRAGNATLSQCSFVTRQFLENLIDCVNNESLSDVYIRPTKDLTLYEQATICPRTSILLVGEVKQRIHIPTETRLYRTGMDFPEYDIREPTITSTKDFRNPDGASMLMEGISRYGKAHPHEDFDIDMINYAFDCVGNKICNLMQSSNMDVRVFSKTEALNSPPKDEYPRFNPIDRTGSAGFPYCQTQGRSSKGDYLYQNQSNQQWYFRDDLASQKVSSDIDLMVSDAKRGTLHYVPFIAYLKDETVDLKKIYDVEKRKTRVFFSGPFDYLISYRMYFGAALARLTELNTLIPPKVGTSSHMSDWHRMTHFLLGMCDSGIATDFSAFDATVPLPFMQGVIRVLNLIYKRCDPNWTIEDHIARFTLHQAVEGGYIIVGDKVYKLDQAQLSGNPGTAIENSIIVWALYFLCWLILALIHAPHLANFDAFEEYIRLVCYGDDNLATIHPDVQSWFNFSNFVKTCAKFGFKATDALKTGADVPDIQHITEMDFLKRKFRYLQGYWTGQLSMESLGKWLHWVRSTPAYDKTSLPWPVSGDINTISVSLNHIWPDIAMHGEEEYYRLRDKILSQSCKLGLQLNPPLWEDACSQFGYNVKGTRQ